MSLLDAGQLGAALDGWHDEDRLQAAVAQARDSGALLSVVGRYLHYASAMAGAAAHLVGEIASRPRLFRDPHEPVRLLADRASEVAALCLAGADLGLQDAPAQRALAHALLTGLGAFHGYTPERLNEVIDLNHAAETALRAVHEGYGVGRRLDQDEQLFAAIGFHLAAVPLTDRDGVALDRGLRSTRPGMVAALEGMEVEARGGRHNAYRWLALHVGREPSHLEAGARAGSAALAYYSGEAPELVRGWILKGVARMGELRRQFFPTLSAGI